MNQLDKVTGEFLSLLAYMRDNYFRPAEQIARHHLSPAQFQALSTLARKGSMTMSELACEMRVSKQQLTPLVCRLIDNNLVVRHSDPKDRRIVRICINDEGLSILGQLRAEIKQAFARRLGVLGAEHLDELEQMLAKIKDILSSIPQK